MQDAERDVMKRLNRVHVFALAAIVVWVYYIWFYEHGMLRNQFTSPTFALGEPKSDFAPSPGVPALYREFCQFLEQAIEGSEGSLASPELILRAVLLAHRHGERSPLILPVQGSASPDCSAYHDIDRRSFDAYTRFIDSEEFRSFLDVDEMFAGYPWYPARSQCSIGNMTAEGALQLVKLGAFLRGKYEHSGIFQADRSLHVSVSASPYRRTFQSAIALTSSFLYPFHEQLRQVHLRGSKNTFFCLNEQCLCPDAVNMRKQYDMELGKYFVSSPADVRRRLREAASAVGLEKMEHGPNQFVDLVLGRYICRRLPLPCRWGNCVTSEDVVQAADEASNLMRRVGELERTRKLHVGEANAILNELVDTLKRIAGSTSPKSTYIKVFSGHDVTLHPLLTVLGIRHQLQGVHYA
ncbi:Histidine phosphatase superfamily, partial [Aphelenchoides avenae]